MVGHPEVIHFTAALTFGSSFFTHHLDFVHRWHRSWGRNHHGWLRDQGSKGVRRRTRPRPHSVSYDSRHRRTEAGVQLRPYWRPGIAVFSHFDSETSVAAFPEEISRSRTGQDRRPPQGCISRAWNGREGGSDVPGDLPGPGAGAWTVL